MDHDYHPDGDTKPPIESTADRMVGGTGCEHRAMRVAEIVRESEGPAAIVRLDREDKLNAFTYTMIEAIREAVHDAAADPAIAGIVITGTGRAFSAGLDMVDLGRSSRGEVGPTAKNQPVPERRELRALFSFLLDAPKPVIAAVNGVCAGGGVVLAMMCDLRFASTSATFTTAFAKRGLIAEHATAWLLPRMMGTSRALDVLWSSRKFDAEEAYRMGFADRLVAPDDLLGTATAYVRELAASVAPRSVAAMKRQVYDGLSMSIGQSCDDADALMRASVDHPDLKEGIESFLERRPPRFAPAD
jgi:enoyl-CoA hydratase/carnithine racemase